jgi:hypothetical protein
MAAWIAHGDRQEVSSYRKIPQNTKGKTTKLHHRCYSQPPKHLKKLKYINLDIEVVGRYS